MILLNLLMPGIDSREVCRRVREFHPKTQISYFTTKAEPDPLKLNELRREADAFIVKPATSRRMLSTVSSVLEDAQ